MSFLTYFQSLKQPEQRWFVTRQQMKAYNDPNSSPSSKDPEILPPGPTPAPRR